MSIEDLIRDLTAIAAEYPSLPVKARAGNGQLFTVDEAYFQADTFGRWVEIA